MLEPRYWAPDKKATLIDIYINQDQLFTKLSKSNLVSKEAIDFLESSEFAIRNIQYEIKIDCFRKLKYEELINQFISNPHKDKQTPQKIKVEPEENTPTIEKASTKKIDYTNKIAALRKLAIQKEKIFWQHSRRTGRFIEYTTSLILDENDSDEIVFTVYSGRSEGKYRLQINRHVFFDEKLCKQLQEQLSSNASSDQKPLSVRLAEQEEKRKKKTENKQEKKETKKKKKTNGNKSGDCWVPGQNKVVRLGTNRINPIMAEVQAEIEREWEEKRKRRLNNLSELPQIGFKDFVVKKDTFKCMANDHEVTNIDAAVGIITNRGDTALQKVCAGYCQQCNKFFIMNSTFEELRKYGIPMCRIIDAQNDSSPYEINGIQLAQESILKQYGYNVSKTENLSELTRQKILALLMDNGVLSRSDIISYLDFFISQRRYQSQYEAAISKWEDDRDFIAHYRIGEYTTYGVSGFYKY